MRRLLALAILLLRVTEGNEQVCRFGPGCQYDCNCAGTCDLQSGCDGNCTRGWDGPTCQRRNVALDQRTRQSSTWQIQYTPELAVDGKVGHDLFKTPCTHTQSDSQSWWMVTLDKTYSIYRFQIYNRDSNYGFRLNGFTLSVGNNSQGYITCYTGITRTAGPGDIINGRCHRAPISGNMVLISLPRAPRRPLTLCEVLLFVCSEGWYGEMCDKECVTTTNCSQCDANRLSCQNCVTGRWGTDCDLDCGYCWNNTACHKNTGHCLHSSPRCEAGYEGNNCTTPCTGGRYGPDCLESCGNCTQGEDSCNPISGDCPTEPNKSTCMPGYTGTNCKTPCSSYRWGSDCQETCGQCHGGGVCDRFRGECPPGNPRCDTGYTGPSCTPCESGKWGENCPNSCSKNCADPACNVTTGVCEGGCHPGYTGKRCDKECPDGTYGVLCQESCGECKDGNNTCDRVSGTCTSCAVGWQGDRCEEEIKVAGSQSVVGVIVGCVVGVILTSVLITTVVLCVRRRQSGGSVGAAVSAENTGVTQDVPLSEPSSRTQGQDTDPVTYYNMASEEHPYETVPEKEYDKMRFSRLDIDTDSNYTSLT